MALERKWEQVPPRNFIEDGKENGEIVLNDTIYLRVKQEVKITAAGEKTQQLQVKRVLSPNRIILGPNDNNINSRTNLSAYTVAKLAQLSAVEQDKKVPSDKDQMKHSYEQEPILARRVINVDPYGDFYTISNPVPVQLSDGSVNIGTVNAELEVQLSHKDNDPDSGDVHDSVRVGDGEHELEINNEGSINVRLDQSPDPLNSIVIDKNIASPNNPWIGDWFKTRSDGFVRQLTVVASNVNAEESLFTQILDTVTGNAGNVDTVISDSVTNILGNLYLASISREDPNADVTSVTGLGLTWQQVGTSSNSTRATDIWYASGTPTSGGAITASFSQNADSSHISVSTVSNADDESPIWNFVTDSGNSSTPTSSVLSSVEGGMSYMAISIDNRDLTVDPNYKIVSEEIGGSPTDGLGVIKRENITVGTDVPTATLDSSVQWTSVSLTVKPKNTPLGGIFTFEYSDDGVNNNGISEPRPIGTFSTVRDFDLLNAGEFYRVKFEPNRELDDNEFVFITTTQRRQNDGHFVRLLNQILEESNLALPHITTFLKGMTSGGKSANFRIGSLDKRNSSQTIPNANQTVIGEYVDSRGFSSALAFIFSDQPLADVKIQWSKDGVNPRIGALSTSPFIASEQEIGGFFVYLTAVTTFVDNFYRLEYTVGNSGPTIFEADVWTYHNSYPSTFITPSDPLSSLSIALLTRSIFAGLDPNNIFKNIRIQGNHSGNSSTTPLPGNTGGDDHIFRGIWFPWQENYVKLAADINSDVSGTLIVEFSQLENPVNGDDSSVDGDPIIIPYTPDGSPLLRRHLPVQSKWVRIKFVNGLAAQSFFDLDTSFLTADPGSATLPLRRIPENNVMSSVTRAILTIPDATGESFQDYPVRSDTGNPKGSVEEIHDDVAIRPLNLSKFEQITTNTNPTRLDSSQIDHRRSISVKNLGPGRAAIGHSDTITYESDSWNMEVGEAVSLLLNNDKELWGVTENVGGVNATLKRSGVTASGTVTNPNNVLASDNIRAIMDANGETVEVGGFTPGTTNNIVSVKLGIECRKQAGQVAQVTFVDVVTGTSPSSGSVSSGTVTANSQHLYVISISWLNTSAQITNVSGMGLSWNPVGVIGDSSHESRTAIWIGSGTPTSGVVTTSFSALHGGACIAVSRYSGVNLNDPINNFETLGSSSASNSYSDSINGPNKGLLVVAVGMKDKTHTAGSDSIERHETNQASNAALATTTRQLASTGNHAYSGTFNGTVKWTLVAMTLNSGPAADPIVKLSYEYNNVAGATSSNLTISSESDSVKTVNVTGDRVWVASDINNVDVIAEAISIGQANLEIDHIFVEIIDTTGNTSRFAVWQGGLEVT